MVPFNYFPFVVARCTGHWKQEVLLPHLAAVLPGWLRRLHRKQLLARQGPCQQMFCSSGKARQTPAGPCPPLSCPARSAVCKLHYNSLKNLKRHWYKVVKSAMFTKVIIQFTSRVSFPLIKRPDPFAENKENAKEMKLKTTLCWMLVTLLLLSFAQAEELPRGACGRCILFA